MEIEQVFAPDEMKLKAVRRHWSAEELLSQDGVFFLKDIVGKINVTSADVKKAARAIVESGRCPYRVMGVRKVWNHWTVRMAVFRDYYARHLASPITRIEANWNANRLLEQKGLFLLSEVCSILPFKAHQLRYQAKQHPDSRRAYPLCQDS